MGIGKDTYEEPVQAKETAGVEALDVFDVVNQHNLLEIILQLKIISRKLDCLQPDDEQLDADDLDNLEQ